MQILQVCGWQEMHSKTSCEKAYSTHCPAPDTSQPQVELREESPNIKSVEKNDKHPETRNKTGRKIVDGPEPQACEHWSWSRKSGFSRNRAESIVCQVETDTIFLLTIRC